MKCIACDDDARAVCQMCGRAVCREHIQERPFVSGFQEYSLMLPSLKGVTVRDAVWCGCCHPEYQSVPEDASE